MSYDTVVPTNYTVGGEYMYHNLEKVMNKTLGKHWKFKDLLCLLIFTCEHFFVVIRLKKKKKERTKNTILQLSSFYKRDLTLKISRKHGEWYSRP